jgi:CII-binding regulator of phage lambda lysogenization HflD
MSAMVDLINLSLPHPRQLPSREDIRHSKSIIDQLDQTIENLEQNIKQLQMQLQEAQRKRANYVSYISPLRRLPTEILSEIIDICIKGGVSVIKMASICTRMREVILGMAGIWRNISLRPKPSGMTYKIHYFEHSTEVSH